MSIVTYSFKNKKKFVLFICLTMVYLNIENLNIYLIIENRWERFNAVAYFNLSFLMLELIISVRNR
jgi:hypothetical protein